MKEPEIWKQMEGIEQEETMEEELREHWLYIMLMDRPGNLGISESGLRAIHLNCQQYNILLLPLQSLDLCTFLKKLCQA